jgi:hypothetical protein
MAFNWNSRERPETCSFHRIAPIKHGAAAVHDRRRIELFPNHHRKLRLFGLDPYDLALSKLERNSQIDRDDIKYLFKTIPLDLDVLAHRYRTEQRPYLSNQERHDRTLTLWTDMLKEQ